MEASTKKKRSVKFIIFGLLIFISVVLAFVYYNFNRMLSEAIMKNFNSNVVSEVYEFKFEKLSVDLLTGNIKVYNVVMQPLKKPLRNYPYINSSFRLTTKKIALENVKIRLLLKSGVLQLEKIAIEKPEIELKIAGDFPKFLPINETMDTVNKADKRKFITAFSLKEFQLADASIHVTNTAAQREFNIGKLVFSLHDLSIDQPLGKDLLTINRVDFAVGEFKGSMQKETVKHLVFKDFKLNVDSLQIEKTIDTLIFHFNDFGVDLAALDIQSADSIYHFAMGPFRVSYSDKLIKLNNIIFKPNISNAAIQRKYKFQHTEFAAEVTSLSVNRVNFDSLIYRHKIFIDEIVMDRVSAGIFKDNTKPADKNRMPEYFGQQIKAIPLELLIKQVNATNVNLVNTERKPDGSYGKANINRGTLTVKNITNLSSESMLFMNLDAFIENKAHADVKLNFSYQKPQFSMDGIIKKFNLPDLNPLIQSYTPAKVIKGIADEITFSGMVYHTNSEGTMKFLYHDLELDLDLRDKAKWKSSVLAFAANTALQAANPASDDLPPRIVKYHAERDMNKAFTNIMIKSVLSGLKETMIMSKENRKAYQEAKKKTKKDKKK